MTGILGLCLYFYICIIIIIMILDKIFGKKKSKLEEAQELYVALERQLSYEKEKIKFKEQIQEKTAKFAIEADELGKRSLVPALVQFYKRAEEEKNACEEKLLNIEISNKNNLIETLV